MRTKLIVLWTVLGFALLINISTELTRGQTATQSLVCSSEPAPYLEPEQLISLAYAGRLSQQGIPAGETLLDEYEAGNITPVRIVEAAVAACILSNAQTLTTSSSYLNQLNSQLQSLTTLNN